MVRDKKGRFARKNKLKHYFIVFVVLVAGFAMWDDFAGFTDKIVYSEPIVVEKVVDTSKSRIEKMKWEIIDEIEKCESAGFTEDDGIIIWDDNVRGTLKPSEKYSIGVLQFKKGTVQYYYKTLYGKEITKKEALLIALDRKKSRQLAYDIVWRVKGGIYNWELCARKGGLISKATVIKELGI